MSFENEIKFCLKFLRLQNSSNEPSIFSPISLLSSLAIAGIGADGNTAEEIFNIIGKKDQDITEVIKYYANFVKRYKNVNTMIADNEKVFTSKTVASDCSSLLTGSSNISLPLEPLPSLTGMHINDTELKQRSRGIRGPAPRKRVIKDDGSPGFELFITNQLFVDKNDTQFIENFNELIKTNFDDDQLLQVIDCKDSKEEHIAKIITKAINEATNEKFNINFKSEDIKDAPLFLINATYFKGKWAIPFSFCEKRTFCSKIPREMNFISKKLCKIPYNEEKGCWKSVGIPYQGHKQWMFIVLPNDKNGLQNLINKMDDLMFKEFTKINTSRCVNVTIPAFEISKHYSLNRQDLGINDLFDPNVCNLSKMIDPQKNYYFGNILHAAIIKIDEYGNGASEITKNPRVAGCGPIYFKADHPFLYFIVSANRQKGEDGRYINEVPSEILFAGIYC